jgi:hypothetical protein
MCRTGMCLQACSNEGNQQGGSLHAALIQCAAANQCYDDACTRARCGAQVDACLADTGGMPPIAARDDRRPPEQHRAPPAPEAPEDRIAPPPPPPPPARDEHVAPPAPRDEPRPAPEGLTPTAAALGGEWAYGAKTAIGTVDPKTGARRPGTGSGGVLHLSSDGRFERATNVETAQGACKLSTFTYQVGAWKLDGATLVLAVKQAEASFRDSCHKAKNYDREEAAKDERRAIRMSDPKELAITDDAGELQSYRKRQ